MPPAPPNRRLWYCLIGACIASPYAPPGYNDGRLALWRQVGGRRKPKLPEFERSIQKLYELIRDAAFEDGVRIAGPRDDALMTAKRWLDEASYEAEQVLAN